MSLAPIPIQDETFLRDNFQLPPLKEVVARLMETISSGSASAMQVGELLKTDPGLVAQVLKVVNSAYFGLPRRIPDVRHAVAYLGLAEIRRIVIAAQVMDGLRPDDARDFRDFWEHSFLTALVSKLVAKRAEPTLDLEDLHIAALLHDVGKLVYMKFFPEHYGEMVQHARAESRLLCHAEEHFGLPSHRELGMLLCRHWSLPMPVARACETHEPSDLAQLARPDSGDPFLKVVCLSNILANLAMTQLEPGLRTEIVKMTQEVLGCSEPEFLALMGEVYDLKGEVDRFLDVL